MKSSRAPDEQEVRELLLRVLRLGAGRYDQLSREAVPQWDSLKHMELVFALEDEYGVRFDESEFAGLTSPAAITAMVRKRIAT